MFAADFILTLLLDGILLLDYSLSTPQHVLAGKSSAYDNHLDFDLLSRHGLCWFIDDEDKN